MYSADPPATSEADGLNESEAPPPTFIPVQNLPLQQVGSQKRGNAHLVAIIELAYRLILILRTAYICLNFFPGPEYPSRTWDKFYVHELIRMGPAILGWSFVNLIIYGSFRGKYGGLELFIPHLIYSVGFIVVSSQLKTATSKEETTPSTLSVVKRWISVNTALLVFEIVWDSLVFLFFFSLGESVPAEFFVSEALISFLVIAYQVATLRTVKSFKDELEPQPSLGLEQGVPLQQGMMLMVMNPGVGVGQLPVVLPQAYQMGNQYPQMATYAYPQQQQQQTSNMIALQDDEFF